MFCDAIVFWLPILWKWLPLKKVNSIPSTLLLGYLRENHLLMCSALKLVIRLELALLKRSYVMVCTSQSLSFAIRVNLFHPYPSLFLSSLLLSLWYFSSLVNYQFQASGHNDATCAATELL